MGRQYIAGALPSLFRRVRQRRHLWSAAARMISNERGGKGGRKMSPVLQKKWKKSSEGDSIERWRSSIGRGRRSLRICSRKSCSDWTMNFVAKRTRDCLGKCPICHLKSERNILEFGYWVSVSIRPTSYSKQRAFYKNQKRSTLHCT